MLQCSCVRFSDAKKTQRKRPLYLLKLGTLQVELVENELCKNVSIIHLKLLLGYGKLQDRDKPKILLGRSPATDQKPMLDSAGSSKESKLGQTHNALFLGNLMEFNLYYRTAMVHPSEYRSNGAV